MTVGITGGWVNSVFILRNPFLLKLSNKPMGRIRISKLLMALSSDSFEIGCKSLKATLNQHLLCQKTIALYRQGDLLLQMSLCFSLLSLVMRGLSTRAINASPQKQHFNTKIIDSSVFGRCGWIIVGGKKRVIQSLKSCQHPIKNVILREMF